MLAALERDAQHPRSGEGTPPVYSLTRKTPMSRTTPLAVAAVVSTFAVLAIVAALNGPGGGPSDTSFDPGRASHAVADASSPRLNEETEQDYAELARIAGALPLIVEDPSRPAPKYSRASFGRDWVDVDGNGCRQRDDVLARDLVDVVRAENGCTVLRGVLQKDPYTGRRIMFQHDRVAEPGNRGSQGVQGEHIVSLKAAHAGGAWTWDDAKRIQFANDLDNIIAVDGTANESKGDAGPSRWLPPTDYRCTYVATYTLILQRWQLSVSAADRTALTNALSVCARSSM